MEPAALGQRRDSVGRKGGAERPGPANKRAESGAEAEVSPKGGTCIHKRFLKAKPDRPLDRRAVDADPQSGVSWRGHTTVSGTAGLWMARALLLMGLVLRQ